MEVNEIIFLIMAVISAITCVIIHVLNKENLLRLIFMIPLFVLVSPFVCVALFMACLVPIFDYLEI